MSERLKGTVKKFFREKKFGFIKPDIGEKDLFFHVSQLPDGMDSIQPDTRVSFVAGATDKGPCAKSITIFD